jgi:hypothetical protein
VSVEATPAFFGGPGELEDHGERGLIGETSLGAHRAEADGRERAFDAGLLAEQRNKRLVEVAGGEDVALAGQDRA